MITTALSLWIAAQGGAPLSADDVVARAVASSAPIAAATAEVDQARAEGGFAWDLKDPEARFEIRHFESTYATPAPGEELPYLMDEAILALRWSPPALSAFGPAQTAAARRVDAKRSDLDETVRDVAAEARTVHARVLSLRAELALARTAVELAGRSREDVQRRVAAGAATTLDESFAALDALDALGDTAQLEREVRTAEASLRAAASLPPDAPVELAPRGAGPCEALVLEDQALVDQALARSPALARLAAEIEGVNADRVAAWTNLVPWIDVLEVSGRNEPEPRPDSLRGQIGVTLPIFELSPARFDVLDARRRRLDAEARAARERVALDVRRAVAEVRGDRELVRVLDEAGAGVVARGLDAVERALAAGEADVVDVGVVRARALRAQRQRVRAELRCDEDAIELMRLVGDERLLGGAARPR